MVNFFVMKFCMINYFRKMLNLCGGWRAFNNFESYEFNSKIEDFNQFIDSWNRRLDLVNMFGITRVWTLTYVRWRSGDSIFGTGGLAQ